MSNQNNESKSTFLSQFKISIWRIFLSNMLRKMSFYLSIVMAFGIVAVCLFWPTLGYEVIMGGKTLLNQTARCSPSEINSSTIMIGYKDGSDETRYHHHVTNMVKQFALSIRNLEFCGNETHCERLVYERSDPRKSPYVFRKDLHNSFYLILIEIGKDEHPSLMIKVPFQHIHSLAQLKSSLLPFKSHLDGLLANYLHSITGSKLGTIKFGWNKFLKDRSFQIKGSKYLKLLSKYSSGVMATHVYIGMVCMALHMSWAFVSDKESGMRSLLSVMGMFRMPYILSYLLIYQIICIVISVYGTVFVIIWHDLIEPDLRTLTTYLYILANYIGIAYLVISQSFIMSTLVGFSRIVTFMNLIVHCFQMIVSMTVLKFQLDNIQEGEKYKTSPLLDYGFPVIGFINVQIELFTGSSATDVSKPVWRKIFFMICMSAFNCLLGIYLDMCFSSGTGHTYHWYFPVSVISKYLKKRNKSTKINRNSNNLKENKSFSVNNENYVEEVNDNIVKISLEKVRKVFTKRMFFKKKEFVAVRNVSLKIQEGMITALLGHNGAGKTTLFNILLGLLKPTTGSVSIYGLSPNNPWDKSKLNQMTSVCMQFDVLFSNLTCREHMKLFGTYKGLLETEINDEVNTLFKKLDLLQEKDNVVSILSGGQLRKLCVALALLGNPKIVLLDEPTSGVDPISRRCIWSVLKEYKANRVIILITHYMDEADIIADWKAIIVKGTVACYGTSMFLKKNFNLGYVFTCTIKPDIDFKDIEKLFFFILNVAPTAFFKKRHGMEVTFRLDGNDIIAFSQFISTDYGATQLQNLGVIDYGISVTKLEEIFLKLGDMELELFEQSNRLNKINEVGKKVMSKLLQKQISGQSSPFNSEFDLDEISNKTMTFTSPKSTSERVHQFMNFKKESDWDIQSRASTSKRMNSLSIALDMKISKKSYFRIGLSQLFTFIRLNILLALRSPMFAILRTIGPFAAVIIAGLLYKFEMGYTKDFQQYKYFNESKFNQRFWPFSIFYNFHQDIQNMDKMNFMTDMNCIRQFYGPMPLYLNETSSFEFVYSSAYLTINNYSNPDNFDVTFHYYSKDHFRYIFPIQTLLQNCLFNREFKMPSTSVDKHPIHFFSIFSNWPIVWAETFHPSFTMTKAFVYLMALSTSFSLMNPVIAGDVVRDRMLQNLDEMKLYGLQFMSYWSSHFILHQLHFMLILSFTILAMYTAGNNLFCTPSYAFIFMLIYFMSSIDTILVIYVVSFLFQDIATAEIAFSFSILFPMFILAITVFFPLKFIHFLHTVCIVLMPFLNPWITFMLLDFRSRRITHYHLETLNSEFSYSIQELLDYEAVYNSLIVHSVRIILGTIVFIFINIYIFLIKNKIDQPHRFIDLLRHPKNSMAGVSISQTIEDMVKQANTDIKDNKSFIDRVMQENESEDKIIAIVADMTKLYKGVRSTKVAISHVSLVINKGEVFGLLGPSGAGKTTSLNCISHMICPSAGQVVVYDVHSKTFMSGAHAVKKNKVGLCPQTNPIWMNLTVHEHLLLYSALRSIPRNKRHEHSQRLIGLVHLSEYTNTRAGDLSGGCKRRLSLAISFTGDPYLILLDEPSCGVDPKSRRNLWDTISNAIHNTYRGAVITTQFMEECEALCNRLAIVVNGRVMCIGSPQELKSKFGRGMNVELKMPPSLDKETSDKLKESITAHIKHKYPKLLLIEYFGERITYRIPKDPLISFGEVFSTVHEAKRLFGLEDYAVSQPTLEQIYFDFARFQTNEDLKYDVQIHFRN